MSDMIVSRRSKVFDIRMQVPSIEIINRRPTNAPAVQPYQ